jgi:hypothetical protein
MNFKIKQAFLANTKILITYLMYFWVFLSFISFNNVITFDGHLYMDLVDSIKNLNFSNWDMLRTPLYPILLTFLDFCKFDFLLLNSIFYILTIKIISDILSKYHINFKEQLLVFICFLSPVLITYQHTFLLEAAITFLLIFIFWVAQKDFKSDWGKYLILSSVMILSYYFKPNFKYLAVVVFPLVFFTDHFHQVKKITLKHLLPPFVGFLIFFICIFAWDNELKKSGRVDQQFQIFTIIMGAAPSSSEFMGIYSEDYKKRVAKDFPRGGLPLDVLYSYDLNQIPEKNLLLASLINEPSHYLRALVRSISNFIISPPTNSDNKIIGNFVMPRSNEITATKILPFNPKMQTLIDKVNDRYLIPYQPGIIVSIINFLSAPLNMLTSIFFVFLPFLFFLAIYKKNKVATLSTGIPLAYIGMHAIALFGNDRYIAPTIPLVYVGVILSYIFLFRSPNVSFK